MAFSLLPGASWNASACSLELFPERFGLFTRLSLLNIVIVKSEYFIAKEECSRLISRYKAEKTRLSG